MTKQELRNSIKQTLKNESPTFKKRSAEICSKIVNSEVYKNSSTILAYMALSDEPDLTPLLDNALSQKKAVYIPKITPGTSEMHFYEYRKNAISEGAYSISEPAETLPQFNENEINGNTLILIPGRAFTSNGDRLGRGKAFYDTFLFKIKKAAEKSTAYKILLAGVCFSCQLVESIPVEPHDIKMDLIFEE